MSDILTSHCDAGKGQGTLSDQRLKRVSRQPGKVICNNLAALKQEIEKLNPDNKTELIEAVTKLQVYRKCNKAR